MHFVNAKGILSAQNGIPAIVWLSLILPFINDTRENIEGLLDYCRGAS